MDDPKDPFSEAETQKIVSTGRRGPVVTSDPRVQEDSVERARNERN